MNKQIQIRKSTLEAMKEIRNHLYSDVFFIDEDTAKENGFIYDNIELSYHMELLIEQIENKEGK